MQIKKPNVTVILTCPLCLGDEWTDEPNHKGEYECCRCHKLALPDEMIIHIDEPQQTTNISPIRLNMPEKMQSIVAKHGYTICDPDIVTMYCLVTLQTTLTTGDVFSKRLASHNSISSLLQSMEDFYRETNDDSWYKMISEAIVYQNNETEILENVKKIQQSLKALLCDLYENCPRVDEQMRELPLIVLEPRR